MHPYMSPPAFPEKLKPAVPASSSHSAASVAKVRPTAEAQSTSTPLRKLEDGTASAQPVATEQVSQDAPEYPVAHAQIPSAVQLPCEPQELGEQVVVGTGIGTGTGTGTGTVTVTGTS
eukprot:SAG31_NODE_9100_length_1334_cov_1.651822_1_plen_118_part_00